MKYVSIDPGYNGAIVCLNEDNTLEVHGIPQIGDKPDLVGIKNILSKYTENAMFGLEDVHSFPGIAANSMAKLMEIKGVKQGILIALGVPYVMIAPKEWQKTAFIGVSNMKKSNGKNDTKGMALIAAKRLFPNETFLATERSRVPHDGIVDATLMSFYLKTKYGK